MNGWKVGMLLLTIKIPAHTPHIHIHIHNRTDIIVCNCVTFAFFRWFSFQWPFNIQVWLSQAQFFTMSLELTVEKKLLSWPKGIRRFNPAAKCAQFFLLLAHDNGKCNSGYRSRIFSSFQAEWKMNALTIPTHGIPYPVELFHENWKCS